MNPDEKICTNKQMSCFGTQIPRKFDFDGSINDSCSVTFPAGYSIFVEKFTLDEAGPDSFVLLDGKELDYHSEVKWGNRAQLFWKNLPENNPLRDEYIRRDNVQCVRSLKVFNSYAVGVIYCLRCRYGR